jgi:hypothetical protein
MRNTRNSHRPEVGKTDVKITTRIWKDYIKTGIKEPEWEGSDWTDVV